MTMRRDVRGEGPAQAQETRREGAAPGKRTLVEGVFPNAAAAKLLLQAKIDARMTTLDAALTAKWIPIPDTAGVAGSTGYIAGQAVLNPLIAAVKAYAARKRWV